MKTYLPFLLICGGILPLHAEEHVTIMNVNTGSGKKSVQVTTRSRITFSNDLGKMIVEDGMTAQTQTFDVDDIAGISFILDSAVKVEEAAIDELKISNSGKVLTITGAGAIEYAVWDTSGMLITSGTAGECVSIDFNEFNEGVYVIRANQSTIKYLNH